MRQPPFWFYRFYNWIQINSLPFHPTKIRTPRRWRKWSDGFFFFLFDFFLPFFRVVCYHPMLYRVSASYTHTRRFGKKKESSDQYCEAWKIKILIPHYEEERRNGGHDGISDTVCHTCKWRAPKPGDSIASKVGMCVSVCFFVGRFTWAMVIEPNNWGIGAETCVARASAVRRGLNFCEKLKIPTSGYPPRFCKCNDE